MVGTSDMASIVDATRAISIQYTVILGPCGPLEYFESVGLIILIDLTML